MRRLHGTTAPIEHHRAEEADLLDGILHLVNRDTVADVVRVLNEQEDDTREDLRETAANQPTQTCISLH